MADIVKITVDKNEASFIVNCGDPGFAKNLSDKVYGLWKKFNENGKKRGTYTHEMAACGDLLACVPCNENLLLWFDVQTDCEHDKKVDTICDFVRRCATELYLSIG